MERAHSCTTCGGVLEQIQGSRWKCKFCGSIYDEVDILKKSDNIRRLLGDALDAEKQKYINNLRRNLYQAVNAPDISNHDVHEACTALRRLLPDDFLANFYEVAVGANAHALPPRIREIDVEAHYTEVEGIIKFLIRSLQPEFLLELNDLVERTYKLKDLTKYEQYATAISEEASKVQRLVYETKCPRDVFVAYSSKDMDAVSTLVSYLESQNLSCFVAARNLRHGKGAVENYERALEEAMDHCKTFVFVSSLNSRSIDCDALRLEIPYIQQKDVANAPPEFRNHYAKIPAAYKKPRVEYRIQESASRNAADTITGEFFDGYERVYSPEEVCRRVMQQIIAVPNGGASERATKICVSCRTENDRGNKYCSNCHGMVFVDTQADYVEYLQSQLHQAQHTQSGGAAVEGGCDVRITGHGGNRLQVVKILREATGWGLQEAMEFVDGLPRSLGRTMTPTQAQRLVSRLNTCGAMAQVIDKNKPAGNDSGDPVQTPGSSLTAAEAHQVALEYRDGTNGRTADARQFLRYCSASAQKGYAPAQYDLGLAYRNGTGMAPSPEKATAWFAKAAGQGHAEAQYRLAMAYYEGQGAPQNVSEAFKWFKTAAKESTEAQYMLGLCYENGYGTAVDTATAAQWYEKAAVYGHTQAAERANAYRRQAEANARGGSNAKAPKDSEISPKSGAVALFLCLIFGWLGIHAFYTGNIIKGMISVLLVLLGLGGIFYLHLGMLPLTLLLLVIIAVAFVDLIRIAAGKYKDGRGRTVSLSTK